MTTTLPTTTSEQSMKQGLQATLHCLDVRLEDELARYRRRRRGAAVMPMGLRREPAKPASLDLISIKAATLEHETLPRLQSTSYSSVAAAMAATQSHFESPPLVDLGPDNGTEAVWVAADGSLAEGPIADPEPPSQARMVPGGPPGLEPEPIALESSLAVITAPNLVSPAQPLRSGDYLASSEALLESLAQAEQESLAAPPPGRILEALFSPLGVGGLLLTLLTSATLGYFIVNPASIASLQSRLQPQSAPIATEPLQTNPAPSQAVSPSGEVIPGETIATGPDLSSKEFVDLSIDTLSGVSAQGAATLLPPVSGASATAGAPTPAAQLNPPIDPATLIPRRTQTSITVTEQPSLMSNLMSAVSIGRQLPVINQIPFIGQAPAPAAPRPAAPRPAAAAQPARPAQAPRPARPPIGQAPSQSAPVSPAVPLPPPPMIPIDPNATGSTGTTESAPSPRETIVEESYNYTVVTPYSSEKALTQIRQYAPDAKVIKTPEGDQIQAASFGDLAQAGSLAGQLRGQGFSVQVEQRPVPPAAPEPPATGPATTQPAQ